MQKLYDPTLVHSNNVKKNMHLLRRSTFIYNKNIVQALENREKILQYRIKYIEKSDKM